MYPYSDQGQANERVATWASQAAYYPAPSTGLSASSHYTDSTFGLSSASAPSDVYHPSNHRYQDSMATATYATSYVTQVTHTTRGSGDTTLVGSAYQVQGKKCGGFKAFFGNRKPITSTWYPSGYQYVSSLSPLLTNLNSLVLYLFSRSSPLPMTFLPILSFSSASHFLVVVL